MDIIPDMALTDESPVRPVDYAPPGEYPLDVEVVSAADLRARVEQVPDRGFERIDFHCLIVVTGGEYRHTVFLCTSG